MAAPGDTAVLILTGSPGAGKTTTARVMAGRSERAVHLESDLFCLGDSCGRPRFRGP